MRSTSRPFLLKLGSTTYQAPRLRFASGTLTFSAGEAVYTPPGGGGGGGAWTGSGYTGTASRIAGFSGAGAAAEYTGAGVLDLLLTTRGDLPLRGAGTTARLPVGAANYMLLSDGTDPAWASPASVRTALDLATYYQPLDADLTALAALGDGIPVRASGTWSASTADTVVSDAAGANGIVVRTSAGAVTARTVTAGDGITITNGDGVSGNPTIAVQQSVKGFQLYQLFTVIQPQGVSVPNVDGVGATITSSGLYSVNPSEAGFPCTQYGDASAAGSRFYVLGYFRIEAATMTTDILFKMGSDISAGITVVHIGFSSSTSVGSADPTGHRYTIRWARGTDTNWQLSVKDGTTQTLVDTGVAVTADYYYAVRFVASTASVAVQISAGSTVATAKSGIDAAGTTSTSSNLPLSANDLYAIFSMQRSVASTSRCLKFGYWRTIQVP